MGIKRRPISSRRYRDRSPSQMPSDTVAVLAEAMRGEVENLSRLGVVWPAHLVDAHAKFLSGKWFRWRLTRLDRQRAVLSLMKTYEVE